METRVRVLVLDPNSDYVGLADPRTGADPATADRYVDSAGPIVVRSGTSGASRLGLHFRDLEAAQQAALLRLDPVLDRDEYAELAAIAADASPASFEELDRGGDEARQLARRARNLGVHEFGLWSREDDASILGDLADPDIRCLVADLGSLDSPAERSLAAGAVLEQLWSRRAEREPVVIVIDEAHNVCPARPSDPLDVLTTDTIVRIAGEGRKFGLYLILVTQRPQKVHENVLSQCDNLVLMRMNSAADLAHLAEFFSFVPPGLIDRATTLRPGRGGRGGEDRVASGSDQVWRADLERGRDGRVRLGLMPLRLVLAEDDLLVREGLQQILAGASDLEVVGICADVDDLLETISRQRPDVVLTDIRMPPSKTDEGIQVAARLRDTDPEVGVLVLSQYSDPQYVLKLLETGSDGRGYLLKERIHNRVQLSSAIRTVSEGGSVIDPKIVEVLVNARARGDHSPLGELTTREA